MLHEKDTKTKLIFLGGKLNRGRDGFVGTITNRNISNYQFDKAFMGVVGIEVNRNRVYTYDTEDALTKKSVMEEAMSVICLWKERNFLRMAITNMPA